MSEKGRKPFIGTDGYAYYAYGEGAVFEVQTETGAAKYRIIEPLWRENSEKQSYLVEVYQEGSQEELLREMSQERLEYLLSGNNVVQILEGELVELPLMKEEVERYYKFVVQERIKRKREANARLKEDKEYKEILSEEKLLTPLWARAIALQSHEEGDIAKRMGELAKKKMQIFNKHGIEPSVLSAAEVCEECEGSGILKSGKLCHCAKKQQKAIKAYVAATRLVEERKKEQLKEE